MSQSPLTWPSGVARAWLIFAATVAPGLSGWTAYSVAAPQWQSDRLSDYVALVLANTAIVFAPFLMYASGCLTLALFYPQRWLPYFAVRFGVYSGLVLSVHLILVWFGALADVDDVRDLIAACPLILGLLAPLLVRPTIAFWKRRSEAFRTNALAPIFATLALFSLVACAFWPALIIIAPLGIVWLSLPGCCLLAYSRVARLVYRNYGGRGQFSLSEILWLTTWAGAYMGTWRISVSHALHEYAKLPKAPPNCYICTAAARGHRGIVGSQTMMLDDGSTMSVNLQMCRFKAVEIALRATSPCCHAAIRAIYDRVGPWAAKRLKHPILADITYLTLTPAETIVIFVMRSALPDFDSLAMCLYRDPKETSYTSPAIGSPR